MEARIESREVRDQSQQIGEVTLRELAHRTNDGIEVSLFWDRVSAEVSVAVLDGRNGESFAFAVDPAAALDAFKHPYAYAANPR